MIVKLKLNLNNLEILDYELTLISSVIFGYSSYFAMILEFWMSSKFAIAD